MPSAFCARFAAHNRHCWIAAALSLLGAWLAWTFLLTLYTGAVLLFETIRTGDTNLLKPPPWYFPAGAAVAAVLLVWAALDRWMRRFRAPPDRPIIGWHLIPEVLLLPARMTFAIWGHIGARVVLSRSDREDAWHLLGVIAGMGRAERTALAMDFPEAGHLEKLLYALQVTGWIDLHRGEQNWFYRLRSDQEEHLKELMPPETGEAA